MAAHYIRSGATGTGAGDSWDNAWPTFGAATWTRGDTYYVAGGDYTEAVSIVCADSGTTRLTIKKANATDNSSDVGWSTSYESTQAVIIGTITFNGGYITFDGVTGSSRAGHGIKVYDTASASGNATINVYSGKQSIKIHHLEGEGPGMGADDGVSAFKANTTSGTVKGYHISDCYFHDFTQNGLVFTNIVGTSWTDYGLLLEGLVLEDCGYSLYAGHGQGLQFGSGAVGGTIQSYITVCNSILHNITGTAVIAFLGYTTNSHVDIYNNAIYNDNYCFTTDWSDFQASGADAVSPGFIFTSTTSATSTSIRVMNNTIAKMQRALAYFGNDDPSNVLRNNLWVDSYFHQIHYQIEGENCDYWDCDPIITSGIYGVPYDETGQQGESSDPCVSSSGQDFRLRSGCNARGNGIDLSAIFTTDITGADRDAWDIGAYSYDSSVATPPNPPTDLTLTAL